MALIQSPWESEMTKKFMAMGKEVHCDVPSCLMEYTINGTKIKGGSSRIPKGGWIFIACKAGLCKSGHVEEMHMNHNCCAKCKEHMHMCGDKGTCRACLAEFKGPRRDAPPMEWDRNGGRNFALERVNDAIYDAQAKVVELGEKERASNMEKLQAQARADTADTTARAKELRKSKPKGVQLTLLHEAQEAARKTLAALETGNDSETLPDVDTTNEFDLFGPDAEEDEPPEGVLVDTSHRDQVSEVKNRLVKLQEQIEKLEQEGDSPDDSDMEIDEHVDGAGGAGPSGVVSPKPLAGAAGKQPVASTKSTKSGKSGKSVASTKPPTSEKRLKQQREYAQRKRDRERLELERLKLKVRHYELQFDDMLTYLKQNWTEAKAAQAEAHITALQKARFGKTKSPAPNTPDEEDPEVVNDDSDAEDNAPLTERAGKKKKQASA